MIQGPGNVVIQNKYKNNLSKNIHFQFLFKSAFLNKNRFNYAIYDGNRMAGFALLTPNGSNLALQLIVTNEKKGYGRQLMNKIKLNAGGRKIILNSLNNARNFYTKQGFRPNGRTQFSYIRK
jgi:GNAT superfamily N-acetyltransferase